MSSVIPAETAIRDWVNSKPTLVGPGNPLSNGAYLIQQRSPATGAYAVLARSLAPAARVVAEDNDPMMVRIIGLVYAPTQDLSELAAAALAAAWDDLQGMPEPCGATGIRVLVADNVSGPLFQPQPADSGEQFCFQVGADFMLTAH